jgi:sialate O-acetylesterase
MILANATVEDYVCVDAGARAPLGLVSSVFGSSMVLQRDTDAGVVYGWAPAGATAVTVVITRAADNATVANASAVPAPGTGAWRAPLPRMAGSLEPFTITVAAIGASARVVLEDVLFGDIYFITGQSNAQFSVDLGVNVSAELEAANNYPNIRLFTVGIGTLSAVPLDNLQTLLQPWTRASNESVGLGPWAAFSAVGWYFCRDLFNAMSGAVPVGCVGKQVHARTQASPPRVSPPNLFPPPFDSRHSNWGGTPIECWSDSATLDECPGANRDPTTDSTMSNAMIVPFTSPSLSPFPLSGFVWYQGEANAGSPAYACELPALIASWRSAFASPTAWFGIVQLAAWDCCGGDAIAFTRDVQLNVSLAVPNAGFATAADLGDINSPQSSIHPRFKQAVGARLASSRFAAMTGGADPLVNPRVENVRPAAAAPGSVAVAVSFIASTLGPGPLALNSTAACPPGVPTYNCEDGGWRIQTADGAWRNATAALAGDARGVTLTAPADAAAGAPVAASLGWSSWPILALARADTGQVALPFLRPVEMS